MLDTRRTLVLNADYRPLQTYPLSLISVQDAIVAVYKEKVTLVEDWGDFFRSEKLNFPVPKTVALKGYAQTQGTPKFSRRSIFLRDRYCCQYCGQRFPTQELTFDHVLPRSKGGTTCWENILTCCIPCNTGKRSSLVTYGRKRKPGKWVPLKEPRQPTNYELLKAGIEFLDTSVAENWTSWLYWDVELHR